MVVDVLGYGKGTKLFGAVTAAVVSHEKYGCACMPWVDWFHSFEQRLCGFKVVNI